MNWEEIRAKYESSDITMKDLAEQYGVKPSTLRSRKNREGWQQKEASQSNKKNATQHMQRKANVATQKKSATTRSKELKAPSLSETEKAIREIRRNEELTEKQQLFCLHYSQNHNATQAYISAYDSIYTTAMVEGHKLLRNPKVKAELDRIKEARATDWLINEADIINEWIKQAFSDISDYVTFKVVEEPKRDMFGGKIIDEDTNEVIMQRRNVIEFTDSSKVDGTLIQEVKQGKDGASIKLYDKQRALQELYKLIGAENVFKLEKMDTDLQRAKVELKAVREEIEGSGEDSAEDDGFLAAIDQSLAEVWGGADES